MAVREEEKRRIIGLLSKPNRPINVIGKLRKRNTAPEYNSESLKKRSKETASKRVARHAKVLRKMGEN